MLASILVHSHSGLRWIVLLTLLFAILRGYSGWLGGRKWIKADNMARMFAVISAHLQLVLGVVLYFVSPKVSAFRADIGAGMKDSLLRFFAMEHSLMMVIAVILLTVFSAVAKRKTDDKKKFRLMAIGFTIVLLIILAMIPWPWSGSHPGGWS
jgi:hypothetical protein